MQRRHNVSPFYYQMHNDTNLLFSENQRFKQGWLWMILAGVNSLLLVGVFRQVLFGKPFGDKPLSNGGLVAVAAFLLLLTILFATATLQTRIRHDGIYVRFFPIHFSFRYYAWNTIAKLSVRRYHPIGEFGGWGLRAGFPGAGKALTVSGNAGLQLRFLNGKKLLIGTNKPEALTATLTQLGQLPPETKTDTPLEKQP